MDKSEQFLYQKAFEIGYAVLRLIPNLKGDSLASYLEERSLDLVDAVSVGEYDRAKLAILSLGHLLQLGAEANLVSYKVTEVVSEELSHLNAAIDNFDNEEPIPEIDIKEVMVEAKNAFKKSGKKEVASEENSSLSDLDSSDAQEYADFRVTQEVRDDEEINVTDSFGLLKSAISGNTAKVNSYSGQERNSIILEKIRQSGYCRLRDLQELLPEISERTIRYDLEKLSGTGLIERFGNGGPATYYRMKRQVA
ncbi:MAG: DeoR family transcriptional regulator [Candidatus Liptonbacteria bacterium]|nr:DeoR family transcriptional regulator [Candidatus Liptonbacteria bacterium]